MVFWGTTPPPLDSDYIPPLSPLNFSIYDIIGIVVIIALLTYAFIFAVVNLAVAACSAVHTWTNGPTKQLAEGSPAKKGKVPSDMPVVRGIVVDDSTASTKGVVATTVGVTTTVVTAATVATSYTPTQRAPYTICLRLLEVVLSSWILRATVLRASDKPTTR
jgi:hypothetical protein